MQTRQKSDLAFLEQYSQRLWDGSAHLLSRPADNPVDAAASLGIGMGTTRPWQTAGLGQTDVESALRSLDMPLGKFGHQAQTVHNTTMYAAGSTSAGCPMQTATRLDYPARDVRSAPGAVDPGPPIRDDMPIHAAQQRIGAGSRNQLRDTFGYRAP